MKKISKNMAKYLVISDFCRTFALRKRIKNKLAMKKQTMITLALALTLAMPTLPAFAQIGRAHV